MWADFKKTMPRPFALPTPRQNLEQLALTTCLSPFNVSIHDDMCRVVHTDVFTSQIDEPDLFIRDTDKGYVIHVQFQVDNLGIVQYVNSDDQVTAAYVGNLKKFEQKPRKSPVASTEDLGYIPSVYKAHGQGVFIAFTGPRKKIMIGQWEEDLLVSGEESTRTHTALGTFTNNKQKSGYVSKHNRNSSEQKYIGCCDSKEFDGCTCIRQVEKHVQEALCMAIKCKERFDHTIKSGKSGRKRKRRRTTLECE